MEVTQWKEFAETIAIFPITQTAELDQVAEHQLSI